MTLSPYGPTGDMTLYELDHLWHKCQAYRTLNLQYIVEEMGTFSLRIQ